MSFYCHERVEIFLTVCFVVELGTKAFFNVTDVSPGVTDIVDPSTLGSADGPVVPDGDDPATAMVLR